MKIAKPGVSGFERSGNPDTYAAAFPVYRDLSVAEIPIRLACFGISVPLRCTQIPKHRWSERGFTLMEVLVAITIVAIVMGSIYGAFRAGSSCVSLTEERANVYQTARVLLGQINAELCSAYQPAQAEQSALVGEDTPGSSTGIQSDALSFMTTGRHTTSRTQTAGDVCKVTYSLQTTPDGEPAGFFVEEDFRPGLDLSEERRPPIKLTDMVVGFNCKYLDPDTDEWQDEWIERVKMPKAVRVEIMLKPDRENAKPIMFASTSNIMASPATSPEPPNAPNVEAPNAR